MASRPKNWNELSEEAREDWNVKDRERRRKWREDNPEKSAERNRKYNAKLRTQADADRFFQLMNAANEIKKAISEINQSNEI
jgi:hypothetical protein